LAVLDAGEEDAIALALELHADLLLMDDEAGAIAARARGLEVTGTLGVLQRATQRPDDAAQHRQDRDNL
jgi:predicted nucleic acid-binding protein